MTIKTTDELLAWLDLKIKAFDWAQENVSPNKSDFEDNVKMQAIYRQLIVGRGAVMACAAVEKYYGIPHHQLRANSNVPDSLEMTISEFRAMVRKALHSARQEGIE